MKFSEYPIKTLREPPADEKAINAKLLAQGGFIGKLAAGVYTFLPLGLRVLNKIENIVREEMNRAGGVELLMPALHPASLWQKTGRWTSFDALFKTKSNFGPDYALGPTHEEVIYPLLTHYVFSYKDLPLALYQIQTKFRDEKRPTSGLLRGREFRMKDLYSFHADEKDRDRYYDIMRRAYLKIFKRLGLDVIETKASGGTFSQFSAEFQVVSPAGEDTIFFCKKCHKGINKEVAGGENLKCSFCQGELTQERAIEVGNIFPLKEKFAQDFKLSFKDKNGKDQLVQAGCYGLGTSRALGAVAEISRDENGIIWPKEAAPFQVHLIEIKKYGEKIYKELTRAGIEVLYDDREEATAGEKFADADLIGIPLRAVISSGAGRKIEIKKRNEKEPRLLTLKELITMLQEP